MENLNIDSNSVIRQLALAIDRQNSPSKILAASFKNVAQVNNALAAGAHAVTAGADVLNQLSPCHLSKRRLMIFLTIGLLLKIVVPFR